MLPAAVLAADFVFDNLGANPIEEVMHRLGWWGLIFLMLSLAITPFRWVTGWNRLVRYRRFAGLLAFTYLTTHFLSYVVLDQFFGWSYIIEDIVERPFIMSGFAAWVLLTPLAITSTRKWIRRLGRRWTKLHRLVYVASALGVLHYYWKVKADTREPLVFAAVLMLLLLLRIPAVGRRVAGLRRVVLSARSTMGK